MNEQLVRQQFGSNAENYAASPVHAKGASLARLVELVQPQSEWRVLDVATGAGHTAFAFAPHVAEVVASDLTPEMLAIGARLAGEKGLTNVRFELAAAASLPFADASFDLVTCRIAPHHFDSIKAFIDEARRVLKGGGILAVVDNIVPVGEAGRFVNHFEKLRDPSHGCCLSLDEWVELFARAGFSILHTEVARKSIEFEGWWQRMSVAQELATRLRELLLGAEGEARDFLAPHFEGDVLWFELSEGIIVGTK